MTRPLHEYEEAMRWVAWGLNDSQVARMTGVPRRTIRNWRSDLGIGPPGRRRAKQRFSDCPRCDGVPLSEVPYAYLLGLYLGDGCISRMPHKAVFKLRITLDTKYPMIIQECRNAIHQMRPLYPMKVGTVTKIGCTEIYGQWKHWPCVFPQHGAGPKYLRPIVLQPWQEKIAMKYPDRLLRGLVHSDGSRDLNVVNGKSYPRYTFANNSADIQEIFTTACERFGIHWNRTYWKTISVARRADVEKLDRVVGPKR